MNKTRRYKIRKSEYSFQILEMPTGDHILVFREEYSGQSDPPFVRKVFVPKRDFRHNKGETT